MRSDYPGQSHATTRLVIQLFLPFAMLAAFASAWLLVYGVLHLRQVSKRPARGWLPKRLQLTAFSMMAYFYPSFTQASLSIFSCYRVDHPVPSETTYAENLQASTALQHPVLLLVLERMAGAHINP